MRPRADEEDTFNKLRRTPFDELNNLTNILWHGYGASDSDEFRRDLELLIKANNWDQSEFFTERNRRDDERRRHL